MENKTLSVKVSSELYNKIKELSGNEGCKISFLINKAVKNFLVAKKYLEK